MESVQTQMKVSHLRSQVKSNSGGLAGLCGMMPACISFYTPYNMPANKEPVLPRYILFRVPASVPTASVGSGFPNGGQFPDMEKSWEKAQMKISAQDIAQKARIPQHS